MCIRLMQSIAGIVVLKLGFLAFGGVWYPIEMASSARFLFHSTDSLLGDPRVYPAPHKWWTPHFKSCRACFTILLTTYRSWVGASMMSYIIENRPHETFQLPVSVRRTASTWARVNPVSSFSFAMRTHFDVSRYYILTSVVLTISIDPPCGWQI